MRQFSPMGYLPVNILEKRPRKTACHFKPFASPRIVNGEAIGHTVWRILDRNDHDLRLPCVCAAFVRVFAYRAFASVIYAVPFQTLGSVRLLDNQIAYRRKYRACRFRRENSPACLREKITKAHSVRPSRNAFTVSNGTFGAFLMFSGISPSSSIVTICAFPSSP